MKKMYINKQDGKKILEAKRRMQQTAAARAMYNNRIRYVGDNDLILNAIITSHKSCTGKIDRLPPDDICSAYVYIRAYENKIDDETSRCPRRRVPRPGFRHSAAAPSRNAYGLTFSR